MLLLLTLEAVAVLLGVTNLSGTATTNTTTNTNTAAVLPGNTFSVPPGITVGVAVAFSGTDTATFFK